MSAVHYSVEQFTAFLTVDNPPVNAISHSVRQGLADGITAAQKDERVKSIVIHCAGRSFMAGADIKEFGKPPQEPHLPDVCHHIEACNKPVIAVIHGVALGGGLEIALGAHYRIADESAQLGLPEVNLGLIPGAGGTQRTPRLIGVEAATDLITSGKPIRADKALTLGLIDAVVEGALKKAALKFAHSVQEKEIPKPYAQKPAIPSETFFEDTRRLLSKRKKGFEAPQACINAVEAASTLSFMDGMKRERELFIECRNSSQSAAQRHMFFAERESLKVEDVPRETSAYPIKSVAIIGAGTMGAGIAIAFLDKGMPVILKEVSEEALKAGINRVEMNYAQQVKKGRLSEAMKDSRLALLKGSIDYGDLSDVDLVIEAAFEKMDIKKLIFAELDKAVKKTCILATNTSYLDVNEIAESVSNPKNVIGLHFFSPANIMKLLEIVRGKATSIETLNTALQLCKKIGKVGVVSGVCFGFIGNRMFQHYQREVGLLMIEGATPWQIDQALTKYGMPMGPCAVADLAGLDIGYFTRQSLSDDQYEAKAFLLHDRLVEMDRKGQKTGAGFYDYADRQGSPSAMVENMLSEISQELGIERRAVSEAEIVERTIDALICSGSEILSEGIAARSSDIDVVYCNGYGFPRWRGGPMHYATHHGKAIIRARIEGYAEKFGNRWWRVSDWLKD
ncbi:3-hydroxyacyl-CoA dehydrogenase NAD-binding domain-containing protein [Temperatibacter marinus]|uniref:3-hydroxyacyl-CoA dehydrogenase NAD-binding domain-containing protein n=1 Tax=Temperatibacter marinus TaxID=1456591 RepID=A0AA52H7X6_9PROT|nr:3-hydroxyacyl-CoA dehydrogenase NAD-binding domain-containing protein [Temperatibacter marinus]WND01536.1 3-hydroxyacyl-CoA dehydrogenase NAD-binding domain-containing protein [Temperatibacter marinus]